MLALAAQGALQIQIGEAISLIATTDFPAQWGELVDVSLSAKFHFAI